MSVNWWGIYIKLLIHVVHKKFTVWLDSSLNSPKIFMMEFKLKKWKFYVNRCNIHQSVMIIFDFTFLTHTDLPSDNWTLPVFSRNHHEEVHQRHAGFMIHVSSHNGSYSLWGGSNSQGGEKKKKLVQQSQWPALLLLLSFTF